jgi:hypothetical protein
MAVKLKKIQRRNPQNVALSKWYLTQESAGSVGLQEVVKEIEGRSMRANAVVFSNRHRGKAFLIISRVSEYGRVSVSLQTGA